MSDFEKAITQTKGAIAYYHKNKQTLFNNIMDELFFPVFEMSEKAWEKLSKCTISKFHQKYKTPFERVRDDLQQNYGIDNPSQALFNIFIQGSKHYEGFSTKINDSIKLEQEYMCQIIGGRTTTLIDLNRVYIQNIGHLFIESLDLSI